MNYNHLIKIDTCEVCGNKELDIVLNLGLHPMCDDLVEVGDERVCKEYPIEILYCKTCFTAHQKYQIPKAELFPKNYHYRSRFTADVLHGMADLVTSCESTFGSLEGKKVLDIGCNDGSLLDIFKSKRAVTYGVEPTSACQDALAKGHLVLGEFFTTEIAKSFVKEYGTMDFICFTNVFAHIEDLNAALDALKVIINPKTVIVIENHYLGAVLQGSQFDTFYHEHPRTYSYQSFVFIAKSLGLDLLNVQFPSRYGGNIRVYMGKNEAVENINNEEVLTIERTFENQFSLMNKQIIHWQQKKKAFIREYVEKNGKIKAKAFPGRAAILVKMLDLSHNEIECVFEKPGSMKIGHYLPGTKIPICSDDELFVNINENPILLNMAWHISKEITNYLINKGYKGEIVNIFDKQDLA
jgi:SAM-dependent methyltransferase